MQDVNSNKYLFDFSSTISQVKNITYKGGIIIVKLNNNSNTIADMCAKQILELEEVIEKANKSLAHAPRGHIIVSKSNGCVQYYLKMPTEDRKYLSKAEIKKIRALVQKEYDEEILKKAVMQKEILEKYVYRLRKSNLADVYANMKEEKQSLINPYYLPDDEYIKRWLQEQYEGKRIDDDMPEILTERGERVRSKSEKIIADKLYSMGNPYKYEYPLKLNYGIIYPDFTLLDVKSRKEIYLEHFGMMDDPDYSKSAIKKIESFGKSGYTLGIDWIATFEASRSSLNVKILENTLIDMGLCGDSKKIYGH